MENQTIIVLKSENAAQEIYCPYCSKQQKVDINLVAHILKSNGEGVTTCICYKCKEEFVIEAIDFIFFETSKLFKPKKGDQ